MLPSSGIVTVTLTKGIGMELVMAIGWITSVAVILMSAVYFILWEMFSKDSLSDRCMRHQVFSVCVMGVGYVFMYVFYTGIVFLV